MVYKRCLGMEKYFCKENLLCLIKVINWDLVISVKPSVKSR